MRLEKAEFRIDVFSLTACEEAITPSPDEEMSKLLPPKICGDELKTTRSCGAQQESQSLSLKRKGKEMKVTWISRVLILKEAQIPTLSSLSKSSR